MTLVCPITSKIRGDEFAILLTDEMVTESLDLESEIRCNKVTTIRNSLLLEKIGELRFKYRDEVLEKIQSSFDDGKIKYFENQQ